MPSAPDPHAIPSDELVTHADFVRSMAFALLRDDADADDAAQDTLAIALERGPDVPEARRSWLATVARNVAAGFRRTGARRDRREHAVARPEATASTADVAAAAETLRLVARAVFALDGLDRDVVLLRHYDGLAPRDIAARLQLSVPAVKSRLQRAHTRLRERLDADGAVAAARRRRVLGAIAGVPVAGVPVAGPAEAAIGEAAGPTPVVTKVAGDVGVVGSGAKGVAVAAAVVVAVGGAVWVLASRGEGTTEGGRAVPASAMEITVGGGLAADRARAPQPLESGGGSGGPTVDAGTAPPQASGSALPTDDTLEALRTVLPEGVIEGIVFVGTARASGMRVTLEPIAGPPPPAPRDTSGDIELVTDADGTFRRTGVPAQPFRVRLQPEGHPARWVAWRGDLGEARRLVVVVGDGGIVGTVRNRRGTAAPSRELKATLTDAERGRGRVYLEVSTDAEGRYALTGLPAGTWKVQADVARDPSRGPDFVADVVRVPAATTVSCDLGPSAPQPRWTGVVRSAGGALIAGPGSLLVAPVDGEVNPTRVPIDSSAAFAHRLAPGRRWASVHLDGQPADVRVEVEIPDQDLVRDVTVPGVMLAGTVEGLADGTRPPVSDPGGWRVHLWLEGAADGGAPVHNRPVLEDGRFRIVGVLPGRYVMRVGRGRPPVIGPSVPVVVTDRDLAGFVLSAP